jgi:hypothetical protein
MLVDSWWLVAFALCMYVYAGHQTWWRMLLTDPTANDCLLTAEFRNGTLPFWVYAVFVMFWLPLVAFCWTTMKISR